MGVIIAVCFVVHYFMSILVCNLDREERAGCFAWFVFQVSCDCCMALHRGAMCLSAVCDCVFFLIILTYFKKNTVGLD